ncbi:m7GpppN-mRNA hydrolase-like isoform X2 [Amphibalanus amphitrite]|uniref:m7GpppN-mRNA hydrolase-like isoform X2 n=1 Tax=Amphibalanus amphitrite TaxID=1232801 RepID=UPI001C907FC4|nr:m7GpppN-mRNA hydrolase-like isoform X2 [Amphibalanus amphitrite]
MWAKMSNGREHTVPTDILDDLCSRFIINVPEEEKSQTNRIMFQVELAHWFYIDFYCTDESNELQPCGIKQFALHLFHHLPLLRPHLADFEAVLARWREYKLAVPTCGAILLDETCQHVLLVQGFYSRASWGFPKGKCNESELGELHRCAVREVQEEIGYDISEALSREDYLEQVVNEQRVRLYLIPGVSRATKFQPRTRNEIKSIEWFAVADLPTGQRDAPSKAKLGLSPNSFFMVIPFVRALKRWIQQRPAAGPTGGRRRGRERPPDEARGRQQQAGSQVLQDEPTELASRGGSRGRSGGAKAAATPQRPAQPASRGSRSRTKSQSNSSLAEDRSAIGDEFSAPSWENFSFDRKKILDALAG